MWISRAVREESLLACLQPLRVFRHPPQRAVPARNAHPVTIRFAIKNVRKTVR